MNNVGVTRRAAMQQVVAGALAVGVGALSACSNDDGSDDAPETAPTTAAPEPTHDVPDEDFVDMSDVAVIDIDVVDNAFEPRWITVAAGTKVRWTNKGRNHHDIVPEPAGSFVGIKHADFPNGSVHAHTFEDTGDFVYYCSLHGTARNGQNGIIRVV